MMINDIKQIKRNIVKTAYNSREGHIASSLSIVEILYIIYRSVLTDRDYFILSKGHASLALYSTLDFFHCIPYGELSTFCKNNSRLAGHPDRVKMPEVLVSSGSLGHGLPIGVGIAMGLKARKEKGNVYVLVGDGECNEGSIYEAANLAGFHKLKNLCCIIDSNHSSDRALTAHLPGLFNSLKWSTDVVSGHNIHDLKNALEVGCESPRCIIAETTKGNGISFMENNPEWHRKNMNEKQYEQATKELE